MPLWWNGRHRGLKIRWGQLRTGSSPVSGTKAIPLLMQPCPQGYRYFIVKFVCGVIDMRRKRILISILLLALIMIAVILLLPCDHQWIDATCTSARICSECQEIEGEPLGHIWLEATCEAPITCSRCQNTDGEPLGHIWLEATCETPSTCSRCQKTEGEPLGHRWKEATCQTPKKCSVCGKTRGSVSGHSYEWDPLFCAGHNVCIHCDEPEPNIWCPNCDWSLFITGVGINGIICPDCGTRVL